MGFAYDIALFPLRLAAELWALGHARGPRRDEARERLGRSLPPPLPGAVWIHGASVGEARLVAALAHALRAEEPGRRIAASAWTPTGRAALPAPPAVDHAFVAPLDFTGVSERVLAALGPAALVLVETELWPNLLRAAAAHAVPVVVANGRLSEGRMTLYRRLGFVYRAGLASLRSVGAQSAADAERFAALGVPSERIRVTGNLKFDLPPPSARPAETRDRLGLAADRPVLVAGSTADGEDGAVIEAFRRARESHPALFLILAPRHPERSSAVEAELDAAGLRSARLAQSAPGTAGAGDALLVDTLGRLGDLWSIADAAFVGGSLVPVGGHNVLEPAAAGAPVAFGPYTDNVAEPARALEEAGGATRVRGAGDLAAFVAAMLDAPERRRATVEAAAGVIAANRGAVARTLALVRAALAPPPAARAGGAR